MIRLTSPNYEITKINRKTRANGFAEFEVGDIIVFTTTLRNTSGASGGGSYATVIITKNITNGIIIHKGQSELVNLLDGLYELKEVSV